MNLKRGNIFWVNLDPTIGSEIKKKRLCVLIGADPVNKARRTVVVIPLSTSGKGRPPLAIEVNCLNRRSVAVCDQIRAVDKSRILNEAGALSRKEMNEIEHGLRRLFML